MVFGREESAWWLRAKEEARQDVFTAAREVEAGHKDVCMCDETPRPSTGGV